MAEQGARRGSAMHEDPALPFGEREHEPNCARAFRPRAPLSRQTISRLCPPLSLPQSPLSIYILFDLYLYSEGTQASTLWRVSSWSPSRSCSFRCVSSSPSTLTPTASLESTFDRLPLGCLLFM